MKLSQRKLFLSREYTLEKGFLRIRSKDLTSSTELCVPYEEIDISKIIKQKKTDNIMLIITMIFGVFFLINIFNPNNYNGDGLLEIAIFLFMATVVCGLITYVKSKNVTLIPTLNNGYLEFLKNKPSNEQFEDFILELSNKVIVFLKSKYTAIDLEMPLEPQLINLAWLKDREIITVEEFESLKTKLTGKRGDSIGFNS